MEMSYEAIANRLKLLSHPVRLQILDALRSDAACVCHLETALRRPQPYISQQLAVLRSEGLITDRKEGQNVYYRVTDPTVAALLTAVLGPPQIASPFTRPLAGCPCPQCSTFAPITLSNANGPGNLNRPPILTRGNLYAT